MINQLELVRPETQYLNALRYIRDKGKDLPNTRTGISCRTVINIDMAYDASTNKAPIVTSRKAAPKTAISELLGYIRGVTSAAEMRELGAKTWNANANENKAWLANPHRLGEDDLGLIYGAVAKNWPVEVQLQQDRRDEWHWFGGRSSIDLFHKVYNNLKKGIDDRGEIITFWHPGMFHLGCLRPCMYEHQFSLIGDDLYLNSTQRSCDWPLGTVANMLQCWLLLRLMAQITDKNPKMAFHKNVNCHIYQSQLDLVDVQLSREPLAEPTIDINPDIKTIEDLERATLDDFTINYTEFHPAIKYPFAV
jgi:thymidylate synthase